MRPRGTSPEPPAAPCCCPRPPAAQERTKNGKGQTSPTNRPAPPPCLSPIAAAQDDARGRCRAAARCSGRAARRRRRRRRGFPRTRASKRSEEPALSFRGPPPPPRPSYGSDTPRPSPRTNRTRRVPSPRTNRTRRVPHPVLLGTRARAAVKPTAPCSACVRPACVSVCAPCAAAGAETHGGARTPPPPHPPSRTDWTRLVPPPVLTGHVSQARKGYAVDARSLLDAAAKAVAEAQAARTSLEGTRTWRGSGSRARRSLHAMSD